MINKYGFNWTQDSLDLLKQTIDKHESILISGTVCTGKSTLLHQLLNALPSKDRVMSVNLDVESTSKERDADAIITALKSNPNWLVYDECRSDVEATTLLHTMQTGHCAMTSIHAQSTRDAIARFNNFTNNQYKKELEAGAFFAIGIQLITSINADNQKVFTATAHRINELYPV